MDHLIVDGYNVLRTDPAYAAHFERDPDAARARLVEDVAAYAEGRYRATVVFDAGANRLADGSPHHVAGVAVIFTKYGSDADETIEALAARDGERGRGCVVATSDAQTQFVVMGSGARRLASRELVAGISETSLEQSTHTSSGSTRSRIEERIDPRTREALFRWARGL